MWAAALFSTKRDMTLPRRTQLADEKAFTFVELLVVLLILGVLIGIAVPAYLNFETTAYSTAAVSTCVR